MGNPAETQGPHHTRAFDTDVISHSGRVPDTRRAIFTRLLSIRAVITSRDSITGGDLRPSQHSRADWAGPSAPHLVIVSLTAGALVMTGHSALPRGKGRVRHGAWKQVIT